jgi:acyl carrier protein
MENDVQHRVLTVICDVLNREASEIRLDASLRNDLEVDSLQQMTLFIGLEDEFQRTIPLEQVMKLDTINDIVEFVHKKLQEPSPA